MKNFLSLLTILILLASCSPTSNLRLLNKSDLIGEYVISNISYFNHDDQKMIPNQDVTINDGKIITIKNTKPQANVSKSTIDGTGKYLIPGLIDGHLHYQGNGSVPWAKVKLNVHHVFQSSIYSGITTAFDLGGVAATTAKNKKKINKGKIWGPDVYNAHIPITIPGAHPIPATKEAMPFPLNLMVPAMMPTVTSKKEAEKVVKKYIKQDIDFVKIICDQLPPGTPEMNYETLSWIINEVHKHKLKAIVHIGSAQNALDAIKAGADVLAHGILRGPLTDEQAKIIASSKIPIIYTLSGFEFTEQMTRGVFVPTHFDSILAPPKILAGITGENGKQVIHSEVIHAFGSSLTTEKVHWKKNFELLYKHHANILVGTDAGVPGYCHGSSIYHEIDELSNYGMSNLEILNAVTYNTAKAFVTKPDFGKISVGFQADLLILNANPINDLNTLKFPELIISNGIQYTRQQ